MSSRLRTMMRLRQEAELAAAMAQRVGNLDDYRSQIQETVRDHLDRDRYEAVPLGEDALMRLYEPLLGESLARRLLESYAAADRRTIQASIADNDQAGLMSPMISSVMQLDR